MDEAMNMPAPLTPPDCDLRDFPYMPLDVVRLRDSDLAGHEDPEVFRTAVLSWCVAWHQLPAASLPDDDAKLARLFGYGRDIKGWQRIRAAGGLYGWIQCSDGRLYHPTVAEKATEAWAVAKKNKGRTAAATRARIEKAALDRDGQRGAGTDVDRDGDRNVDRNVDRDDNRNGDRNGPPTNERTNEQNERTNEAQPRARGLDPEASAIIAEFDAARVAAHGPRRARLAPHSTDAVIASRWVAEGLTAAMLAPLFHARHRARAQAGQDPIDCLRFLDRAVAELGSVAPSQPQSPAGNVRTHPAAELEARKAAYSEALQRHQANPGAEPRPTDAEFGLRYDREKQDIALAPGQRPPIPPPRASQDASCAAPEGPPERVA